MVVRSEGRRNPSCKSSAADPADGWVEGAPTRASLDGGGAPETPERPSGKPMWYESARRLS
jgi:hypothetical protein